MKLSKRYLRKHRASVLFLTITIVFGLFFGIRLLAHQKLPFKKETTSEQNRSDNFIKIGNLIKNNPGFKKDTWYLTYSQSGLSAVSVELNFDKESKCKIDDNSKRCEPEKLIQGQRVQIWGNNNNNVINVNNLEYINTSSEINSNSKTTAIDWKLAQSYLNDCSIKSAVQNKDLTITLTHKDNRVLTVKEPKFDDISKLIKAAKSKCGTVKLTNIK
jgi:hypothetical protein